MAGGDLPPGAVLHGDRLAQLFEVAEDEMREALDALAREGRISKEADGCWRVATLADTPAHDILKRLSPVLRAVVGLAATRISPMEAAGVLAAYDQFAGFAGDGTDASRADGYARMLRKLADAAGSEFYVHALEQLLPTLAPLATLLVVQHVACYRHRAPDDALARLARALMASDAHGAEAAVGDHLMLLGSIARNNPPG